jgi:type I site-specific restriction endonuclease
MMESERQTRKRRIDPLLKALGWKNVPFNPTRPLGFYPNCAIEEYPTDNGPADYELCVNGQIVGVVEAKKLTLASGRRMFSRKRSGTHAVFLQARTTLTAIMCHSFTRQMEK